MSTFNTSFKAIGFLEPTDDDLSYSESVLLGEFPSADEALAAVYAALETDQSFIGGQIRRSVESTAGRAVR